MSSCVETGASMSSFLARSRMLPSAWMGILLRDRATSKASAKLRIAANLPKHDKEGYEVTDLRLDAGDGSYVVVDSRVLKSTASDLILDSAARRKGSKGMRRALVHDQRDGLTINYNRDY